MLRAINSSLLPDRGQLRPLPNLALFDGDSGLQNKGADLYSLLSLSSARNLEAAQICGTWVVCG